MCIWYAPVIGGGPVPIGSVRKKSGGKRQAWYQLQVTTGKHRSLSALVPLSLTTQVCHQ